MSGEQPNNNQHNKAEHLARFRWKKGESGNPSGRPKGSVSLEAELRRRLSDGEEGERLVQGLISQAIRQALGGDFRFFNLIVERLDGKVADKVYLQNDGPLFDEDDIKRLENLVNASDEWND
mgnify:CR=1 FL=1